MTTTTAYARQHIGEVIDSIRIAYKLRDSERERLFTIQLVRLLEALKRAQNASDVALAGRIDTFIIARDYEAAIQAWEGRR